MCAVSPSDMTRRLLGDGYLTPTSCDEVLSVTHHLCEIPKDSGMHPAVQTPVVHATQHMSRLPKVRKQRSRELNELNGNIEKTHQRNYQGVSTNPCFH